MTPQALEQIHRAAFTQDRPWRAAEFTDLLASPHVTLHAAPYGFALTRTVAGESELLTIAVLPTHQRRGIAQALLLQWLAMLKNRADVAFLEVAADNAPARGLYEKVGFAQAGARPAYYARATGPAMDALLMRREMRMAQGAVSPLKSPESG
ncbi:MAG: GNAT family N-acetyltransferase [Pseudomonadota bacterium]